MTKTSLRFVPLVAALLASSAFVACSGSDDSQMLPVGTPKDSGVAGTTSDSDSGVQPDAGTMTTPDSGAPMGCGANPNSCVANQRIGPAPTCACLPECDNGYTWNAATQTCEMGSADCTSNPNGCVAFQRIGPAPTCSCLPECEAGYVWNPGTGTCDPMAQPGCTSDAECNTAMGEQCLDVQTLGACAGGQCDCIVACTPFGANTCPMGGGCAFLPGAAVDGACIPDTGGGTHGQGCRATFDAQGNVTDDDCNRAQNAVCIGVSQMNPIGTCASLCIPGAGGDTHCGGFGGFECEDVGQTPGQVGLCTEPAPMYTDIGNGCMNNSECESMMCSPLLQYCSAPCGATQRCPDGALCVDTGQETLCALECTPGAAGDADCAARAANHVCFDLGGGTGVCAPMM